MAKTETLHLIGDHRDGYFVHNPRTGADVDVVDELGENITEFLEVKKWVAENFAHDDVRGTGSKEV